MLSVESLRLLLSCPGTGIHVYDKADHLKPPLSEVIVDMYLQNEI